MTRLDLNWLDAQYNNRARVGDAAQIMERWVRASAWARENSPVHLDVRYGDGDKETLDLFPAARPGAPVLVFIHGGYWRALDKRDVSFVAPALAQAGALVVVPNYALCPAVSVEHITLQMVRALAWVWRHASKYGGDPRRIVVAGHSAGGHLAAMMLSCRWQDVAADLPASVVGAALSISGIFDMEAIRQSPFLNVDLKLTPASARRLSPALFPPPAGQLFTVVGADESEEFLRQNSLIRAAWGADAVPVCDAIAGTNHFTVLHDLADPRGRLHPLALQLLGLRSN
jgi:arylformamidase